MASISAPPSAPPEPEPLPTGASIVHTPWYDLTHRLLREVMQHRGCLQVQGPGGVGKTRTVDDFFTGGDHDVVKLHLESRPKGYAFLRRLVVALGGSEHGDAEALMGQLRAVVGTRRVYVYIDEADLLSRDSLRQIRYLRDQRDLHIAFVLVGSDFREAFKLVPELWSRITRRVTFEPLSADTLVRTLAAYHPFLAGADADLLKAIDEQHCRGIFRVWSVTLAALLDYADRMAATALTEAVAKAVLGVVVDRARAKRPRAKAIKGTKGHPRKAA